MAEHNQFGIEAEQYATYFLKQKGYQIKQTNWRYQKAEIDIIAKFKEFLVIVEVKARSNSIKSLEIKPQDAITKKKKKLLMMATDAYIEQKNIDLEVRFDVISIYRLKNNWEVEHIENAFEAYDI